MALSYHSQIVEPWGRTPRLPHEVARPHHQDQLPGLIAELYKQPDILLQGIDQTSGCFRPSSETLLA